MQSTVLVHVQISERGQFGFVQVRLTIPQPLKIILLSPREKEKRDQWAKG